jgi:hypothetical protein
MAKRSQTGHYVRVIAAARRYEAVADRDEALDALTRAAIDWAAGGRGQPLVDAAAHALAVGIDSPTLRVLAGASRKTADEEATELAPTVFEELGITVHERLSPEAIVQGARQLAGRFLAENGSPRALARDLWRMSVAAGYTDELAEWSGYDDWYDVLEGGVIAGRVEDADAAVVEAARVLAEGGTPEPVPLNTLFGRPKQERRFRWRRRNRP